MPRTDDLLATFPIIAPGRPLSEQLGGIHDAFFLSQHYGFGYALKDVPRLSTGSGRNQEDQSYKALHQVIRAAEGLRNAADRSPPPSGAVQLFVPVLVTSAPLFRVVVDRLSDSETVQSEPRFMVSTHLGSRQAQRRSVWVVHSSDLEHFASDAVAGARSLYVRP